RLTFAEVAPQALPRSEAFTDEPITPAGGFDLTFIASVVERWRGSTVSQLKVGQEDGKPVAPEVVPIQPAPPPEPPKQFGLLKKPAAGQTDPLTALRQSFMQPKR